MQATTENSLGATLLIILIGLGLLTGGMGWLVGGGIWAFMPVILVIGIFLVWFINGPGRGLLLGGSVILGTILVLWTVIFGAQALEGAAQAVESVIDRSIPEIVTTTVYVTDQTAAPAIAAKYVAGRGFFGGVIAMFLLAIIAQAASILSRRVIGFALAQVVLSGLLIWVLAVMPWQGEYDAMTSASANTIFLWALFGGIIWSFVIQIVMTGRGMMSSLAYGVGPRFTMVVGLLLALTYIIGSLKPDLLMFGVLTNLVHTTALTMDQALLLWQFGVLVGAIGLPAAMQLMSLLGWFLGNILLWLGERGVR